MAEAAPYYSVLIRVDPNNPGSATDFVCDLCTEIPQPSDDGKTYTFKIRDGVKFHDGSPLTAYDVAASWNKIVDPPEGVTSARQSFYVMVDKIETPDPMTVVFRLKFPTSAFLPALADPYTWIYKKEILDKEVVTQFEIARLDRVAVRSHRAHMLTAKQHATEGGAPDRTERVEYAQGTTAGKASTKDDRRRGDRERHQGGHDFDRRDRGRYRPEIGGGGIRKARRKGAQAGANRGAAQRNCQESRP